MMDERIAPVDRERSPLFLRVISAIPIVLVLVGVAFTIRGLGGDAEVAPVAVSASGQRFATLADLALAADVVVEGRIVGFGEGRVITDPADPQAGFSTRLFQLDVISTFGPSAGSQLIIEQEAALLDGSPMVVNGLTPNQIGDVGFWFLVVGNEEEFPYLALVNEQGRMIYDETERVVELFGTEVPVDAMREQLGDWKIGDG